MDKVTKAIKALSPKAQRDFIELVVAVLYWDTRYSRSTIYEPSTHGTASRAGAKGYSHWNTNKEWDSSDFLATIADNVPLQVLRAVRAEGG
jgi:hypothetical protein